MLYVTVSVLILVLLALFAYYNFLVAKREKFVQVEKKYLLTRIDKMKAHFKSDIQQLEKLGVLSHKGQEVAYRLINYYFVFQPITLENVEQCERSLKSLLNTINNKLITDASSPTFVQEQLNHFLRALPTQAAGYNISFYRNDLPMLIQNLGNAQDNSDKKSMPDIKEEIV